MRLSTRELVKSYQARRVVDGVSIDVAEGEVVGLLGKNGAGKTTTFYMVVGLTRPERGQVFLGEREIGRLPVHARARLGIGYLPQERSVFRGLSVEANLRLVLQSGGRDRARIAASIDELLEEFGLTALRERKADLLSGGERRRVEIARALATEPKFILLDEPFTGIDPLEVIAIRRMVLRLKERGIGVLITDHNVQDTLQATDRAYIMLEGKIVAAGAPEAVAADPLAREHYLGDDFELRPRAPLRSPTAAPAASEASS